MPAAAMKVASPMSAPVRASQVERRRARLSRSRSGPLDKEAMRWLVTLRREGSAPPTMKPSLAHAAAARARSANSARTGTVRGWAPWTSTRTPPQRETTWAPVTRRRSAPISPAPAPSAISPLARWRRASLGWASASAR
jgi:hypothetical protein